MADWDEKQTIGLLPERAARRWGTREALAFRANRWTFAEFHTGVDAAAKGLLQFGIKPGDNVALWMVNRPEWLHAMFAIMQIGAVLVPVNTRFRTHDVTYVLGQSDSVAVILADRSGPVDYLGMVREAVPGLGAQPDPRFPSLRRVIALSERAHPDVIGWNEMVENGRRVSDDILRERARAVDPRQSAFVFSGVLFKFAECYELLTQYEPMGRTLGDPGLLGAFYGCLGHCQWFFGELDRAAVTLNEATRLCDMAGNAAAAAYAYMLLEWTHLLQGRHDRVPELRDVALDRLEHKFDLRTHTWARAATSMAYTFEGRWDDALAESEREMRAAEELSDSSNICFAAMMLALNHAFRGDGGSAVRYGDLALQKAVTPADHAWASGFSGLARSRAGDPYRGVELLAPLVEMQRTVGFVGGEFFAVWLGEAYWRAGQPARAVETLEAAIATYERCGMPFFLGSAHRMLAEVLDATDGDHQTGRIARYLASSMGILNKLHARNELAMAYAGYGRFQRQLGQVAEARDSFTRALEIFERLGTLGEPDKVRAELAELSSP